MQIHHVMLYKLIPIVDQIYRRIHLTFLYDHNFSNKVDSGNVGFANKFFNFDKRKKFDSRTRFCRSVSSLFYFI